MSVGTASITAAITRNTRNVLFSGDLVWFRKLVSVVTTGYANSSPSNLVMLVQKGGTTVALAQAPTAPCTFSLDTNTAELEAFMETALDGAVREFDVYFYDTDSTSLELLGKGVLRVLGNKDYAATAPIPPLSASTVFIGSFAFYNGKTYLRSSADQLYYEFAASGSGDQVTESLETVGITIPGSP